MHACAHRANMVNLTIIEYVSRNTTVLVCLTLSYQLFYMFVICHTKNFQKSKLDRDINSQ